MKRIKRLLLATVALGSLTWPGIAPAAEKGWKTVGVRGGLSATPEDVFFHQYEVTSVYALPYDWRTASGFGAAAQIDMGLGILHSRQFDSFLGTVGPDFAIGTPTSPVELEIGVDLTLLNHPYFGHEIFSGGFFFTSHVGLNYRFWKDLGVGYRLQHMSNAGIYGSTAGGSHNGGLNLHVVELNYYLTK